MGERRIEFLPLTEVQPAPVNPKEHDIGEIAASIEHQGFVELPALDERTGRLVAGHGRLEALAWLAKQGRPMPDGLREDGKGGWLVPVLRGWASSSDADAAAYLVGSNRLVELGGWDDEKLDALLVSIAQEGGEVALRGTGYDADDIDRILRGAAAEPELEAPTEGEVWVKPGDLFELGTHRLLCGDSTKEADVARVMDGRRAGLMNTDPPYGVGYDPAELRENGRASKIANDELRERALQGFLESVFRAAKALALSDDAAWYLWHAHLTQGFFAAAAAAANVVLHRQIIWVKPSLILGRGQYHWRHEPCFMGWVDGHQPPDYGEGNGERTQTTVWELDGVPPDERKVLGHSTPKPVRLFEIPILKHLRRGEVCYEPFAGSGPQIIAAEKSGRMCCAIELEPRFVQACVERWQRLTGEKAKKVG